MTRMTVCWVSKASDMTKRNSILFSGSSVQLLRMLRPLGHPALFEIQVFRQCRCCRVVGVIIPIPAAAKDDTRRIAGCEPLIRPEFAMRRPYAVSWLQRKRNLAEVCI